MIVLTVGVGIWMKDVIKSKDFEARREKSGSLKQNQRLGYVLKQAGKLILSEPLIPFAIIGSVIQLFLEIEGSNTTTLIVSYNYTKSCPLPSNPLNTCNKSGDDHAKTFLSLLGIIKVLLSIPFMIFVGWLCGKMNNAVLLIMCYIVTIASGFYMVAFTEEAGSSMNFTVGFLITQIMDSCNFVASQTLLQSMLLPDSRGAILSLNTMMYGFGACFVFGLIESI